MTDVAKAKDIESTDGEQTRRSSHCYLAIPTWSLVRIIRPILPSIHPWKNRRFGLREWRAGQTELCRWFDLYLAASFAGVVIAIAATVAR